MSKILLSNGHLFDLNDPDPTTIDADMIIQSLCMQTRFNGHLDTFYTVGSHTVAMYSVAKARGESGGVLREILLHDAPEFATGDIVAPLKALLGPQYAEIEMRVTQAVRAAFGHLPTEAEIERCKTYDNDIWQAELVASGMDWQWNHSDNEYKHMMYAAVQKMMSLDMQKTYQAFRNGLWLEFSKQETMQ